MSDPIDPNPQGIVPPLRGAKTVPLEQFVDPNAPKPVTQSDRFFAQYEMGLGMRLGEAILEQAALNFTHEFDPEPGYKPQSDYRYASASDEDKRVYDTAQSPKQMEYLWAKRQARHEAERVVATKGVIGETGFGQDHPSLANFADNLPTALAAGIMDPVNAALGAGLSKAIPLAEGAGIAGKLARGAKIATAFTAATEGIMATSEEKHTPEQIATNYLTGLVFSSIFAPLDRPETPKAQKAVGEGVFKVAESVQTGKELPLMNGAKLDRPLDTFSTVELQDPGRRIAALPGEWTYNQISLGESKSPTYKNLLYGMFASEEKGTAGIRRGPPNGGPPIELQVSRNALLNEYGWNKAFKNFQDQFAEYRKQGGKMNEVEFENEVAKAARRGDKHDIPQVANTAKGWRAVDDAILDKSQEVGFIHDAQEIRDKFKENGTAESHFPRVSDRAAVENNVVELQNVIRRNFEKSEGWASATKDEQAKAISDTIANFTGLGHEPTPRYYRASGATGKTLRQRSLMIPDSELEPFLNNRPSDVYRRAVIQQGTRNAMARGYKVISPEVPNLISEVDNLSKALDPEWLGQEPRLAELEAKVAKINESTDKLVEFRKELKDELKAIKETPMVAEGEGGPRFYDEAVKIPSILADEEMAKARLGDNERALKLIKTLSDAKRKLVAIKKHDAEEGYRLTRYTEQIAKEFADQEARVNADKTLKASVRNEAIKQIKLKKEAALQHVNDARNSLTAYRDHADPDAAIAHDLLRFSKAISGTVYAGNFVLSSIPELAAPLLHVGLKDTAEAMYTAVRGLHGLKLSSDERAALHGAWLDGTKDALLTIANKNHPANTSTYDIKMFGERLEHPEAAPIGPKQAYETAKALGQNAPAAAVKAVAQTGLHYVSSAAEKGALIQRVGSAGDIFSTFQKRMAGMLEMNKIFKQTEKGWDNLSEMARRDLLNQGWDKDTFTRLGKQFEQFGDKEGHRVANWEKWTDPEIQRHMYSWLIGRAKVHANEPSVGQMPVVATKSALARVPLIMRNYLFAVHENVWRKLVADPVLAARLGDGELRNQIINKTAYLTAASALIVFAQNYKRVQRGESPTMEYWRQDLINGQAFLAPLAAVNDIVTATMGVNGIQELTGEDPEFGPPKFDSVRALGAIAGPTPGAVSTYIEGLHGLAQSYYQDRDMTPAEIRKIRRGIPGNASLLFYQLGNYLEDKAR